MSHFNGEKNMSSLDDDDNMQVKTVDKHVRLIGGGFADGQNYGVTENGVLVNVASTETWAGVFYNGIPVNQQLDRNMRERPSTDFETMKIDGKNIKRFEQPMLFKPFVESKIHTTSEGKICVNTQRKKKSPKKRKYRNMSQKRKQMMKEKGKSDKKRGKTHRDRKHKFHKKQKMTYEEPCIDDFMMIYWNRDCIDYASFYETQKYSIYNNFEDTNDCFDDYPFSLCVK